MALLYAALGRGATENGAWSVFMFHGNMKTLQASISKAFPAPNRHPLRLETL
jgi:hypothetical protein